MSKPGRFIAGGLFLCAMHCGAQEPVSWAERTLSDSKARETYPVIAKQEGSPLTVDGKLDEWQAVPSCCLSFSPSASVLSPDSPGLADLNGSFQAMWDTQSLYLAVTVTDDELSYSSPAPEDLWANDTVEVFLDLDLEGDLGRREFSEDDAQILLCPLAIMSGGAISNAWYSPQGFKGPVAFAATRTETGYLMETRISFTEDMRARLKAGAQLGVNVAVNDCDKTVWETQFRWFPHGRASADARARNRFRLLGPNDKRDAAKIEAWQFSAGTLRSFYLSGETATVFVAGNENLKDASAKVVFINERGAEETLGDVPSLAGVHRVLIRIPRLQSSLFGECRLRVQSVSDGQVAASEEWPVQVADADALAIDCAQCVRESARTARLTPFIIRLLTAPPLTDAADAKNLVADIHTAHDILEWAAKVKLGAPAAAAPVSSNRTYTFEKCAVTIESPVEVGSATGHYWFSSLHPVSDKEILCEAVRGADVAQGEWPASLHLSRDGGRTWAKALDIDCYGPVSFILEPGKVFLMPYETWPLTPDDKRSVKARATILTCFPDGPVSAERVGIKFVGMPRDIARLLVNEEVQSSLYVNGNILDLGGGKLFATLYGKLVGDRTANLYAFESDDRGRAWRYIATVAEGTKYPAAHDGPSESSSAILQDGRILCIYRMGPVRPKNYYKSYSADQGKTWSKPAPVDAAWSVEPQLVRLDNGALLLSGGRTGLYLWVCPEGDGNRWEKINLADHHNLLTPDIARHYVPSVHDGRQPEYTFGQSTAYTGMKAIGPDTALLSYDRLANGWNGAPGPWGEKDTIYSVRIRVVKR